MRQCGQDEEGAQPEGQASNGRTSLDSVLAKTGNEGLAVREANSVIKEAEEEVSDTLFTRQRQANPDPQHVPLDGAPESGQSLPQANEVAQEQEPGKYTTPEELEKLLQRAIVDYKTSRDHFQEWRQEAAECYDFVASHQWSEEDKQVLADQSRPAITFNRIGPFIDSVCGLEIGNRQDTQYIPRQVGNSGVNDLLTSAAQWVRDDCDAEDEESEAFRDVIVCGVGCAGTRMDYDDDPDGMIVIERIDPLEKFPDPSARKQNFADARFDMRCKDIPLAAAQSMFPDVDSIDLHAQWAEDQPDETRTAAQCAIGAVLPRRSGR